MSEDLLRRSQKEKDEDGNCRPVATTDQPRVELGVLPYAIIIGL
jgi:hypothetical protein